MNGILVRGATSDDLQALADIYNHYVRTSPATFVGPHRLLVAIAGNAIAGYATSGKLREDVHRAYAAIVLPNPASVALHARFGFAPVGTYREAGRKFGRYWDVQWFERPLP